VGGDQRGQAGGALGGEVQAHDAAVLGLRHPPHQPGGLGPVDQFHDAVVAQQQVVGDLPDRRGRAVVAPDGEQQLVLRRREPGGAGLLLAPMEEPPDAVAELQQPPVVLVTQLPPHIASRYRVGG
jgi:hypothetical protein